MIQSSDSIQKRITDMSFTPKDFVVWAEIPTADMNRAVAFYTAVVDADLTIDDTGPNPVAMFKPKDMATGVGGHIYPGKPAGDGSGPTVHLATPDTLEATMERVTKAGGTVVSEPISIPFGRFFYALDLDGNSIGFFEFA